MNTKIYKQVYILAGELMDATRGDNDERFDELYEQLKSLCVDNEADAQKNHPVQWETLADFTQDGAEALAIYEKALSYAKAIEAQDYLASIHYAVALLLTEDKALDATGKKALLAIQQASEYAKKIEDGELRKEIAQLLAKLS